MPIQDINITEFQQKHWNRVHEIYQEGIDTRIATFEKRAPEWEEWNIKFLKNCRIVAISVEQEVLGWAGLQPVSKRKVYEGVAEETVYVASKHTGKGLGKQLLFNLVELSEKNGFWMLTASIFSQNVKSIELHKKAGFKTIGIREKVAKRDGKWTDTVLMDRRSKLVGLD